MSTTRARVLRNNMTEPEVILWSRLKRLRAQGFHFRRQAPFGPYYLDFVSLRHRLVIELDGSQHAEGARAEKDRRRDATLIHQGFRVLRFWNGDVRFRLGAVMDEIQRCLNERVQELAWLGVEVEQD